jgi:sulfite exporter TauE/SafE
VLGYIGSFFAYVGQHRGIPGAVLLIAGFIMVLMGLNIAGVLGKRGLFEESAVTESSFFRKTLHRILNLDSAWAVFLLGLLLGFLPCGLLYPIFINAAASGNFFPGAMTMAVFGLGTAPALIFFGFLVTKIQPKLKLALYRLAAVLIILLGVKTLLRGMAFNGWISHNRFW